MSYDFQQLIPEDITNLPEYSVSGELFICTAIVLGLLLLITLGLAIFWAIRVKGSYFNVDYMVDFSIKQEVHKHTGTIEERMEDKKYIDNCRKFARLESRALEFMCIAVVVALNIDAYTCLTMETVAFVLALLCFALFNFFRVVERIGVLRLVWLLPMLICFLSYYIFEKKLIEQAN